MKVFAVLLSFVALSLCQMDTSCEEFTYQSFSSWGSVECTNDNACFVGPAQSPVRFVGKNDNAALSQLRFTTGYGNGTFVLANRGTTLSFGYNPEGAEFRNFATGEPSFSPVEVVFRSPAEHWINGEQADMEMQFYHVSEDGSQAVISFLFNVQEEDNDNMNWISDNAGSVLDVGDTTDVEFEGFQDWIREMQSEHLDSYFYYAGSETEPPCSSGVYWHVLDTVWGISAAQLAAIKQPTTRAGNPENARGTQRSISRPAYWDATAPENQIGDSRCGAGRPIWDEHPYDCVDQYDSSECFYCKGRSHGADAIGLCLHREGMACDDVFNSQEALTYCNLEFECSGSMMSGLVSFLVFGFLALFF